MLTPRTPLPNALALTGAAASWGIATAIAKHAVTEIPPTSLLPIQLAASLVLLGPLAFFRRPRVPRSPGLRRLGYLGLLNPGIAYALSLLGLAYITASLSVLLWATEPLLISGLAWWYLGERIDRRTVFAALFALAGVALVVLEGGAGEPLGGVLTISGVVACALYTVITRKWIASESTVDVVAIQLTAALAFALLLGGVAAVVGGFGIPAASPSAWISAVASGILYYGVAFWLYLTGLRQVAASWAGLFLTLIPVFGVAASFLLLEERFTLRQWLGASLIVATIAVVGTDRPVRRSSAASS